MINSRELRFLHPIVRTKCEQFIEKCRKQGITVLVTSTYRDNESQDALYAQGRTVAGKKVTNAKGGQSFHNWRVAFDIVPLVNGKAIWNDKALFTKCGEIGESCGLEWGGRWKFTDMPHFQYTGGLTLKDFQAGKTL
jgi:peptidoglycan L-alanyl-D-glutamate endopeptidase CwlK